MSDKAIRILSGILAVDGAVYLLAAWLNPLGWLGYVVWFGWVAIAAFDKLTTCISFWILSSLQNGLLLVIFWESTQWVIGNKSFLYWHSRLHLLIATCISLFAVLELASRNHHLTRDKLTEESS
jgi:hypothetical protein